MNLTLREILILCFLLAALVTGGIVRLCRKGWTLPQSAPSITAPAAGAESPPPAPPS